MIRTFIANRSDGEVEMVEISDEFGNASQMTKTQYDEMKKNEAASKPISPDAQVSNRPNLPRAR